jgi:type I restriction enzyme S subunit
MGSEHRIREEKFSTLEKYQARPGDVLVTVMASLGRSCVLPRDLETSIVTKHVYRISMEEAMILPEHVNLVLQAPGITRARMFKRAGPNPPGT